MKRSILSILVIGMLIFSSCNTPAITETVTVTKTITQSPITLTVTQTVTQIVTAPSSTTVPNTTSTTTTATSAPTPPTTTASLNFGVEMHHTQANSTSFLSSLASAKGWKIIELNIEPLTYKVLQEKGIRLLYIHGQTTMAFTDQELSEIKNFISSGGKLIVESDSGLNRQNTREITKLFNIDITETNILKEMSNLTMSVNSSDPLFLGVNSLYVWSAYWNNNQCPSLQVQSPAKELLSGGETTPYKPIIAKYENSNGGKALVYPINIIISQESADNQVFLNNVLKWCQ